MGRISGVTTKQTSAAAAVNVATSITYQPMSRLVKTFTHGNTLTNESTYSNDYELSQCQVKDGATVVLGRSYARADQLNLTGITDQVTAANNQTLGYSAANRLNSASGVYGSQSWVYDGVGNRTSQTIGAATTTYNYPATSNKMSSLSGATTRTLTYDGAGNPGSVLVALRRGPGQACDQRAGRDDHGLCLQQSQPHEHRDPGSLPVTA